VSVSVFVMTDVVGSTAAWEAHGDAMRAALELHDALVHGSMISAGGRVFKHTGDGMIAVFDGADAAVNAALSAADALARAEWDDVGPLEIRVSIHAGAAAERNGDFFGPPVNKTARINGVAHAGQVLLSDVAHELMADPRGRDLGMHQLKDLSEPMRLWQLDDGDHPPLRTLNKARHNLPVMSTDFIGRRAEIDELRSMVSDRRLVTITGVGGCGKTRLAVEVAAALADRFPGGVWFADMTTERDGDQVPNRCVAALGLVPSLGVDAAGPVKLLNEATAGTPTLLVIDNCEHLVDGVADFAVDVLEGAPDVTVLATSRESLAIDGEWVWRIPNLSDAAVELFVSRATAAGVVVLDEDLDQIEEVCRQLDDIPLAIELAAPRLSSLSIDELASRLDDRFALLGGGRGRRRQRQQTLQAMMDWSYGLLDADEQQLLNELAVFSGSFPLSGVEAVATPTQLPVIDVLESLLERSLVTRSPESGRYRLLETVRLYALDRLVNLDQLPAARDRHLVWMVNLSGVERALAAREEEIWDIQVEQLAEIDNAIAAMEWAEHRGRHDELYSLFFGGQSTWPHIGAIASSLLERIPEPAPNDLERHGAWLATNAHIRIQAGDETTGFEQAFAVAAMFDDLEREGARLDGHLVGLLYRGIFNANSGNIAAALQDADRLKGLQVEGSPRYAAWMSLLIRTNVLLVEGDSEALRSAMELMEEGRAITPFVDGGSPNFAAALLSTSGRFEEALPAALKGLNSEVVGQASQMNHLVSAANAYAGLGHFEDAVDVVEKDFGPMIETQKARLRASQLVALAVILFRLGHLERTNEIIGVAEALAKNFLGADWEVRMHLAEFVGADEEFAALPTPHPEDLTTDSVSTLIDMVITEIRSAIASPRPLDGA